MNDSYDIDGLTDVQRMDIAFRIFVYKWQNYMTPAYRRIGNIMQALTENNDFKELLATVIEDLNEAKRKQ